jgi:hypothetical protein
LSTRWVILTTWRAIIISDKEVINVPAQTVAEVVLGVCGRR